MSWHPGMLSFLNRLEQRSLRVAAGATILLLLAVWITGGSFFRAYLLGWLFWLSVSLGCLGLLLLHHLVNGRWGQSIRRPLESGVRLLPGVGLAFLPLLLGLQEIYPWARHELVEGNHLLEHRSAWLNPSFFVIRAVIYFGLWIALSRRLFRLAQQHELSGSEEDARRLRLIAAPGIVVFVLSLTLASIDWSLSIEPTWFSPMYGLLFMVSCGLSALAFCCASMYWLTNWPPLQEKLDRAISRDLGNLLFAFTMLWAYLAFSQYLITWSADLPEEIPWYERRTHTSWKAIAIALVIFHFATPFLVLLSGFVKDRIRWVARVALFVFAMRLLDQIWLILPAFEEHGLALHAADLLAPVALGGWWLWAFSRQLARTQPIPATIEIPPPAGEHA